MSTLHSIQVVARSLLCCVRIKPQQQRLGRDVAGGGHMDGWMWYIREDALSVRGVDNLLRRVKKCVMPLWGCCQIMYVLEQLKTIENQGTCARTYMHGGRAT